MLQLTFTLLISMYIICKPDVIQIMLVHNMSKSHTNDIQFGGIKKGKLISNILATFLENIPRDVD